MTNFISTDSSNIDIIFTNPSDSVKSIYWYDFVDSWGIPLSFTFSVYGADENVIWKKLNWADYMDNHVYYSKERINKKI